MRSRSTGGDRPANRFYRDVIEAAAVQLAIGQSKALMQRANRRWRKLAVVECDRHFVALSGIAQIRAALNDDRGQGVSLSYYLTHLLAEAVKQFAHRDEVDAVEPLIKLRTP